MSSAGADVRGTKRPQQTCLNCRRKKVKCHGEQPACRFCVRLGQECVYPNRSRAITQQSRATTLDLVESGRYRDLADRIALIESSLNNFKEGSSSTISPLVDPGVVNAHTSPTWNPLNSDSHALSYPSQENPTVIGHPMSRTLSSSPLLPPAQVLQSTIDLYFLFLHNQPYSFFHENTFRQDLATGVLPESLILAVLTMAIRFSHDAFFQNSKEQITSQYAMRAWSMVLQQCFESENGPDYHSVQAATLLAIHDFTACKHSAAWIKIGLAVSMAQAQHLMMEPPTALPHFIQEERRRTLWSIFLLDKMATCGRGRPSLFQDKTCELQLPCSDRAFQSSTPENVITLEAFKNLDDPQIGDLDSFAHTIAIASILSQVAAYTFQQNKTSGEDPPWNHTSEYQRVCSQLTRFETFFQCFSGIQNHLASGFSPQHDGTISFTEPFIFSYVLFNLCYCLLQHPFLLRRRIEASGKRTPTKFFARAIESCWEHSEELTRTLTNAKQAGYNVSATMFSYCSIVAGTINSLFRYSEDERLRIKSSEALKENIAHLEAKAKYWKNAMRMAAALKQFANDSAYYIPLLDTSGQTLPLSPADIERLYSLCDYGTMSTNPKFDEPNIVMNSVNSELLVNNIEFNMPEPVADAQDFSNPVENAMPGPLGNRPTDVMIQGLPAASTDLDWEGSCWDNDF